MTKPSHFYQFSDFIEYDNVVYSDLLLFDDVASNTYIVPVTIRGVI